MPDLFAGVKPSLFGRTYPVALLETIDRGEKYVR
jgi:hypothetical protein